MAWIWLFTYVMLVVSILKWNDALNMETVSDFSENFSRLVEELTLFFQPCGFPIELVTRFCVDRYYRIKQR